MMNAVAHAATQALPSDYRDFGLSSLKTSYLLRRSRRPDSREGEPLESLTRRRGLPLVASGGPRKTEGPRLQSGPSFVTHSPALRHGRGSPCFIQVHPQREDKPWREPFAES